MGTNNNIKWSLYEDVPNTKEKKWLQPLNWKGGDQLSNLIDIVEFFNNKNVSDKTKIVMYKSGCGSGKCVEKDSLILTDKGIIRIEDIVVPTQRIVEATDDTDYVLDRNGGQYIGRTVKSFNLNNVKLEDDIISNVFDMQDNEIINITTRSGFNIKCTPTHKLVVIDDNCNIMFKEAKDISFEDGIAIACGTEIYGENVDLSSFYRTSFYKRHKSDKNDEEDIVIPDKMNEELGELLGYVLSEGGKIQDGKIIRIFGGEKTIRERIQLILDNLNVHSSEFLDSGHRSISGSFDGVRIVSETFCDFLIYLGYIDDSQNKEVPWSILQSSKNVQIAFLRALLSEDGLIASDDSCHIGYRTVSKKLAEQLHIMLLNMGIFSSLRDIHNAYVRENGKRKNCEICYEIFISEADHIMKCIYTVGLAQDNNIYSNMLRSECMDILKVLESKDYKDCQDYKCRTVKGSQVRLKNIYQEFEKLAKDGKIIKTWEENIYLNDDNDKIWKIKKYKKLSAKSAIIERGLKNESIEEWTSGSRLADKKQILRLLEIMKECYYLEDFRHLYNIAISNIEFDDVAGIKTGSGHVYDLTIRDNHSYVGNGFINHNSATLLHIPKEIEGRAIIVTPFKNLQRQYYDHYYVGDKFVVKKDGTRLKVAVLLGRENFKCRYLEEQYEKQQKIIKANEKSGQLMPVNDYILKLYRSDPSCANKGLPCTRSLIVTRDGKREPRWVAASKCPYWIPTPMAKTFLDRMDGKSAGKTNNAHHQNVPFNIPDNSSTRLTEDGATRTYLDRIKRATKCSNIMYYNSVKWGPVGVFIRDKEDMSGRPNPPVCEYYKQFYSYAYADVIVMNSAKWHLETLIGRKPAVDVEMFDEGDYWLDSMDTSIELRRSHIDRIVPVGGYIKRLKSDALSKFDMAFQKIKDNVKRSKRSNGTSIVDARDYVDLYYSSLNLFKAYSTFADEDEKIEEKIVELNTILRHLHGSSVSYEDGTMRESKKIKVFIPYPDNVLKELLTFSSKNIVITSGTMHGEHVLNHLFGINNDNYVVKFLCGRKDNPGRLTCIKPKEILPKITYTSWQNHKFQEYYYKLLNYILDNLKIAIYRKNSKSGKILVLTPAKKYAEGILQRPDVFVDFANVKSQKGNNPNRDSGRNRKTSISHYIDNTLKDVRKGQDDDIQLDGDVLKTDKQIIVSTRMIRGADLKDDLCRGIVILKWPIPDLSDGYYQALKKRFGDNIYWKIIMDKAAREAVQMVSRGLRHDRDWCYFSSTDITCFNNILRIFQEQHV